jgi:hypothetical protein
VLNASDNDRSPSTTSPNFNTSSSTLTPSGTNTAPQLPNSHLPSSLRSRRAPSLRTLGKGSEIEPASPAVTTPNVTSSPASSQAQSGLVQPLTQSTSKKSSTSSTTSKSSSSSSRRIIPSSSYEVRKIPSLPNDKYAADVPAVGMYWSVAPVFGTIPKGIMRGHTMTLVDNIVWLIGAYLERENHRETRQQVIQEREAATKRSKEDLKEKEANGNDGPASGAPMGRKFMYCFDIGPSPFINLLPGLKLFANRYHAMDNARNQRRYSSAISGAYLNPCRPQDRCDRWRLQLCLF